MKELKETIDLMQSADYKERFAAEYYQLETRFIKLRDMIVKWDNGTLNFTPTCPREIYDTQLKAMSSYIMVLIERARIEGIKLEIDLDFKDASK